MPEHEPPPGPVHEDVRYEPSDVSVRGILAFGAGLVLLVVVGHLVSGRLVAVFERQAKASHAPPPPMAEKRPHLPSDLAHIPRPRLEESEVEGLRELREEEEKLLHGSGWVDRDAGMVRIPIEDAMRLLADPTFAERHGIKVRPQKPNRDRADGFK